MYWYAAGAVICGIAAFHVKRKRPEQEKIYKGLLVFSAGLLLAAFICQADKEQGSSNQVIRNEPGQGEEEKEYQVSVEGILEDYPMNVQVKERKLTSQERQEYFDKAKEELDKAVLGENKRKDEITKPLYLPKTLQNGGVEAEYYFSDYEIFDAEGKLLVEPKEPVVVEVTAELSCQGETCLYEFFVQAVPRKKSQEEQYRDKIGDVLARENEEEGKAYLELPEEMEGKDVIWREEKENRSIMAVLLGAAGAVGIFLTEKEKRKREEAARRRQMLLDYPEIVSKLSLLLGAGMNIMTAWEKISGVYRKKREMQETEIRYAYEEMLSVLYEIQSGTGELQALENFGKRCQLSEYRKLSSLLVQNTRKGAKGLQRILEEEEREAFEQRKARAKKAGEEAGTKLLLPMGMMLVIVLIILVLPAGISLHEV
ncbi:MAG: type II secretion system F family protein [Lachnospiraceae bacterium]|nr:type II secretion system F family protein [Lachnospiraceae bacterium]